MMMHVLLLYAMALEASFDGMTLAEGTLINFEIAQCIKEAMEPLWDDVGAALDFVYPKTSYVVFVSFPFSCLLFN